VRGAISDSAVRPVVIVLLDPATDRLPRFLLVAAPHVTLGRCIEPNCRVSLIRIEEIYSLSRDLLLRDCSMERTCFNTAAPCAETGYAAISTARRSSGWLASYR
jgi:hypothetical protein